MSKQEPIHSGHFMTSNPHSEIQQDDEDEDVEVDVVDVDEGISTVQLDKNATKEKDGEKPVTFYKFGPQKMQSIAIDVSLNKLNKCIRVAYMKMTTPKWKDFKGLKLQWKHRIRLNNVIWRAYYMEFRKPKPDRKRKSPYCYFSVPDDDTTHTKIEGSVMEGMYWKRRMEAVCAQYKRWRGYNSKKKRCCRKRENSCGCEMSKGYRLNQMPPNHQQRSLTPENLSTMNNDWFLGSLFDFDDELDDEFTNQLFEQLNAPFIFPNPREVQCANADIMQPGLLSLQPSLEEIMSTDYPFLGTDEFVDSVEFGNSLPLPCETSHIPVSTSSTQQRYSNVPAKLIPPPVTRYNAKEYDPANMLSNYTNQSVHQNASPLQQQQQPQQIPSTSNLHRQQTLPQNFQPTRQNHINPDSQILAGMELTPVLTPNVSTPFYSQASVYEPQKLTAMVTRGATTIQNNNLGYGGARVPSMLTKTANLTSITHPITSMASSAHSSPFLPTSIDYSLLVAASSAALTQVIGQSTIAGPASTRPQSQWSSWFPQQQQSIYQPQTTHHRDQNQFVRKTSGTAIQEQHASPSVPEQFTQISPLALSANRFNTQFSFPSITESGPSITPYTAPLNNLVDRAPLRHQQQSSQLLQSLASASTPPTTVRQFVMSDLSRYLTQQQSAIGVNNTTGFVTTTPSVISNLSVNTPSLAQATTDLSPIATSDFTPITVPHATVITGMYNSNSGSSNNNNDINCQQKSQQMREHLQQIPLQQQPPQCASVGAIDLIGSASPIQKLPRPQKKMSASALPLSNELLPIQKQQFLSRKNRASFSVMHTSTNLGKRQIQDRAEMAPVRQQQQQQQQIFANHLETTSSVELVQSPPKMSRRWSSTTQRQNSMDSVKSKQQTQIIPTSPVQQHPAVVGQIPTQQDPSLGGDVRKYSNELPKQKSTLLMDEINIEHEDEMSLELHQQMTAVKAEESVEEKPTLLFAPMSHKKRHQQQQQHQSNTCSSSSTSNADASTSNSAPADSTLHPEERKRILHLNAEKNRRSALKDGFESLISVIPMVEQAGVKSTNAVLLNRAAQYIRGLKTREEEQKSEIETLRKKIANMNERISLIQSNLPSSSSESKGVGEGATSPSVRVQVEQFFDRYKRERSREDYRFWLMAEVLKPIVHSYAQQIHPDESDREKVLLSARKWLESQWNATTLRPIASDVLVKIATASGAFTNEKALSQYIEQQVSQQDQSSSSSVSSSQHAQQP